jgi:hypothetical protein
MFSTTRTAPPRMGVAMSPGRMTGAMSALPGRSRPAGVVAATGSCRASVVARAGAYDGPSWARSVTGPSSLSGATPNMRSK